MTESALLPKRDHDPLHERDREIAPNLLQKFAERVNAKPRDAWLGKYRTLMGELPRWLHHMDSEAAREAIRHEPETMGRGLDAHLAAMIEHMAFLKGWSVPAWVRHPRHIMESPTPIPGSPLPATSFSLGIPPAFARRNLVFDGAFLDGRSGNLDSWTTRGR